VYVLSVAATQCSDFNCSTSSIFDAVKRAAVPTSYTNNTQQKFLSIPFESLNPIEL
jgi:hypothetical protein